MNVRHYTNLFYTQSPQAIFNKLKRRVARDRVLQYSKQEIYSPKNQRSQRLFDFLNRYETVLQRVHRWNKLDFRNKNVLEIGCGPMLGWAPLAIFRGARHVDCVEIMYNPKVMESEEIAKGYFLNVWRDLSVVYGNEAYSSEQFLGDLHEKVTIHPCYFLDAKLNDKWDISLSNSCFEHVTSLEDNVQYLKETSKDGCRYIHLVDFGNHNGQKKHPLESMYDRTPDEYVKAFGRAINLHRPPDILRMFREAGFNAVLTPLYDARDSFPDQINNWWIERYDEEDLFTRVGLISSAN